MSRRTQKVLRVDTGYFQRESPLREEPTRIPLWPLWTPTASKEKDFMNVHALALNSTGIPTGLWRDPYGTGLSFRIRQVAVSREDLLPG